MFKVNNNIVFREVDDKIVLINLESGFYYSLNECGRFVFNLLCDHLDLTEIIDKITAKYDVTENKVTKDLEQFIGNLELENIVVRTA